MRLCQWQCPLSIAFQSSGSSSQASRRAILENASFFQLHTAKDSTVSSAPFGGGLIQAGPAPCTLPSASPAPPGSFNHLKLQDLESALGQVV